MTSQNYPKTTFSHSVSLEAGRLLYVLNRLTTLEFRTRGFFFLPKLPPRPPDRVVVVPSLAYQQIPRIWTRVQKIKAATPTTGPVDLLSDLSKLFAPHYQESKYLRVKDKLEKSWSMVYREFFDTLYTILPQHHNALKSVNIILTSCGTSCQFSLVTEGNPDLTIYLRLDQDATAIAEGIITALVRPNLQYQLGYNWEEIESIVDFLLRDTLMARVFANSPKGTIANLRKNQLGKLKIESDTYLESLFSSDFTLWRQDGQDIYYSDTKINNLTPKRQLLLEEMLAKRGQTVTFEELGSVMWSNDGQYSLWAITKEISRLRADLAKLGLPKSIIQAHRKTGYSLT